MDDLPMPQNGVGTSRKTREFGELVWHIDNFSDRRRQALNGIEKRIFSDPFYSHKNGYKMCVAVWPVGNVVDNDYLSVYFHIMRGPSDRELLWPFRNTITIALVNQQTGLDHCSETFEYDDWLNADNLRRPTLEKNCGIGTHLIKLKEILDKAALLGNDQIIIKCTVLDR